MGTMHRSIPTHRPPPPVATPDSNTQGHTPTLATPRAIAPCDTNETSRKKRRKRAGREGKGREKGEGRKEVEEGRKKEERETDTSESER
jgi:hypothetical protein